MDRTAAELLVKDRIDTLIAEAEATRLFPRSQRSPRRPRIAPLIALARTMDRLRLMVRGAAA
jgi:hypothetical protein